MANQTSNKQIVLVTGSSGCLGQHVVRLLHEQDDSVQEIRCFDLKPFSNNLKHKITKEMQIITGDIRNEKQLKNAMTGVNVIIHCAALIDLNFQPNLMEMQSVNVDGTQKLLEMAIENNVEYFIHISGTEVNIGNDPIYYSSENTIIIPKKPLLNPYAKTKADSEELIKEFNGRQLSNGSEQLKTVIIRPNLMYGEEDNHFITKILSITKANSGQLRRIDNVFTRMQPVYVGNVAWSCLKAKKRLQIDPKITGEEFIITDDTKIVDPFEFLEPFINARGYQLTKRSYPYWLFIMLFTLYCWLYRNFANILPIRIPDYLTPQTIQFICNTYFFNRTKAILRLDYDPLYDHDESINRSLQYYQKCSI
ncbi:3 beta-hydroxysteroid dehydrogenase type 7 [Dermatophagoides pteronyssinus]|uniref:3 beta-hydroxysteroid dehydrogenase type 7-like n=1 Tax=Dermatophagoides pteronyssinus TaxID=6956 RepID=A0A6P6Y3B3_DERPT|nr:3 beta-hydroxysteroid dehydrogenase type 7-like [Dermatophagoides pteronyssinus]